ncbi:MAG: glycosyltransferase family 4 protein [Elusimicrobia bacterium]|nr:glycosyltransferase family 4 protein [Elusimicrobiota bacterium]
MKVAHVITRLELGGAQRNTLYTVSHLDPAKFQCLLISGEGGMLDGEARALKDQNRIGLYFVPGLIREISPISDVRALVGIIRVLRREKPDVVHTHSSKAGILGRAAARLCGVLVVVHTYHGFGFHPRQGPWARRFFIFLEKLCARWARALVFVSKSNWNEAAARGIGDPRRYRLIRSGIKRSDYPASVPDRGRAKTALGAGFHKVVAVSIGNFKPQKNAMDFISAAEMVLARNSEIEFLYVGDGEMRTAAEARIFARGLSSRIKLLGWRQDVPQILAVSDIFVLTSLWEGLPRALLEAMASGLVPVCYAANGVSEMVQDGVNGFLVAPGDAAALADRVIRLAADESLRRRLSLKAREAVGEEFDIDEMVRRQERLYQDLSSCL